jgi:hypothetical protein
VLDIFFLSIDSDKKYYCTEMFRKLLFDSKLPLFPIEKERLLCDFTRPVDVGTMVARLCLSEDETYPDNERGPDLPYGKLLVAPGVVIVDRPVDKHDKA